MNFAAHYPEAELVARLASALVEASPDDFTGSGLTVAFYDFGRDAALLYEGETRYPAIMAAWTATGMQCATEAERDDELDTDVEGWRMWRRFTAMEAALLLLVERQAVWWRASHTLEDCQGAYPMGGSV